MSDADLACPACGAELDLAVVFQSADDHAAFDRLSANVHPLRTRATQYLALFKPPKHRLKLPKKAAILLRLLPDLERGAITWKGREWPAPPAAWAHALDQVLARRDAGTLELPLRNHAYLYAVLAGMADKHEASAEQAREQQLRTGHRAAVNGPANVADLVQQAAPAAIARPAPTAPVAGTSPTVRAMREQIAKRKGEPS